MKKTIIGLFLTALAGTAFVSCDMDLVKPGVMPTDIPLSLEDIGKFRTHVYNNFRGLTNGSYISNSDLQMDQFNGVEGNGYRGGQFALGQIVPTNSGVTGAYNGCYGVMANINFTLQQIDQFKANGKYSASELQLARRYEAEMRFMRGYFYWYLLDHFAWQYDGTNGDQPNSGLVIVDSYDNSPDFNRDKYHGRSTLNQSITEIQNDLQAAYDIFVELNGGLGGCEPNSISVNACTCLALQARLALYMGQYELAKGYAEKLINTKNYRLCSYKNYPVMWSDDESSELIYVAGANSEEYSLLGSIYTAYNVANSQNVDYLPSEDCLWYYDESSDVRYKSFFLQGTAVVAGKGYTVMKFNKFPGNNKLWGNVGTNGYKNKSKPFRLSETYLILAEACAMLPAQDVRGANDALNAIRSVRIQGFTPEDDYTGQDLIDEVRLERTRELIGEGFRMSDLRRWHLGFTRNGSYSPNPAFETCFLAGGLSVVYQVDDYRYVWPIPENETDVNPKMVQNPGYKK